MGQPGGVAKFPEKNFGRVENHPLASAAEWREYNLPLCEL